jgi:hypothetical protein
MYNLETVGPPPENLSTRVVFENVRVPMLHLADAVNTSGLPLADRQFKDCVIIGPCVVVPAADTVFTHCTMGQPSGDVRNLFLRAAGSRITGGIPLPGCRFEGCLFVGVGFAGDDSFVDAFVKLLGGQDA